MLYGKMLRSAAVPPLLQHVCITPVIHEWRRYSDSTASKNADRKDARCAVASNAMYAMQSPKI